MRLELYINGALGCERSVPMLCLPDGFVWCKIHKIEPYFKINITVSSGLIAWSSLEEYDSGINYYDSSKISKS